MAIISVSHAEFLSNYLMMQLKKRKESTLTCTEAENSVLTLSVFHWLAENVGLCACLLLVTIGIWHVNTSEECWIMRLRTPRYYMHLACALQVKKGDRKPEFSSKHSHEIGP